MSSKSLNNLISQNDIDQEDGYKPDRKNNIIQNKNFLVDPHLNNIHINNYEPNIQNNIYENEQINPNQDSYFQQIGDPSQILKNKQFEDPNLMRLKRLQEQQQMQIKFQLDSMK